MSLDVTLSIEVDTGGEEPYIAYLYDANITHNVTPMWLLAGVYNALYQSDGEQAGNLVGVLRAGYEHMRDNPDEYTPLNPRNGWGDYTSALGFLRGFYYKCRDHPKATLHISK